jgi:F-type H+-transporting ATPase subunit b
MIVSPFVSLLLGAAEANLAEPNPLEWKGDLAIWTAVVFLVLLAVLWKFAWKPIADGLDKREKQIADQIAEAARTNQEARQLLADYQQKLVASRDEVRGILDQGRRDAEALGRELLDKAKGEALAERNRSLQQIEAATAGALQELAQRSASLAVELAGKIVGSRLTASNHTQLIEKAVAEFSAGKR